MTQYKFTVGGQSATGALTWNAIGTLETLAITDGLYSSGSQTCSYTHDDLSRIASANCGTPWSQTFSYDAFGNITKSGTGSFSPTYSYATNQMTQIGSSSPSYDANGNVTNDFLHTYAWDANGRPTTIDTITMTYDALGRAVERLKSGAYTQTVYSPYGKKLALMSGTSFQKAFVSLAGGTVAVYNSSGIQYYRHTDWLGSYRLGSTSSRTLYFDGAYAPFGETYAQSGGTDLSFTGMNQDTVANLFDFPDREYNGIHGRWPSPDPGAIASIRTENPQTLNRYAYVGNRPLFRIDPTGMEDADDCGDTCDDGDDTAGGGGGQVQAGGGAFGGGGAGGSWDPPSLPGTTIFVNGGVPSIDPVDPGTDDPDTPISATNSGTLDTLTLEAAGTATAGAVYGGVYVASNAIADTLDTVGIAIGQANPSLAVSAGNFFEGVEMAEGNFTTGVPETFLGKIGASLQVAAPLNEIIDTVLTFIGGFLF